MAFHKDEAGLSLHALHAFTFATAVERVAGTGYTITAADIGKVAKQTDTNRFYLLVNNSPLTWSEVTAPGGSGGINYISNDGAEDSAASWSAYADAAAATPADGTGGSPNVTVTRTTSNPLRSNASFLITKDAVNRQGQGISFDFTIDRADEAKPLAIEFDYEPLSGFVAGSDSTNSDLVVYVYDLDYSTLIQPAPFKLVGGVGAKHKFLGEFQSSAASGGANARKYRLILHVATTNASAWTFKFDGVRVGPNPISYGSPITDWIAFTPTSTWNTNVTHTGKWRRVGDSMEVLVRILLSGAPNATTLNINLPTGYQIDTAKLNTITNVVVPLGGGHALDSGTGENLLQVRYATTTAVSVYALTANASFVGENNVSDVLPQTFANNDSVEVRFEVPILGWSSSVEISNDTSTRVVACRAHTSTTSLGGTEAAVVFTSKTYDTHNAYDTTNGRFTAPVAGKYRVTASLRFATQSYTSGNLQEIYIAKNGTTVSLMDRNYYESSQSTIAQVDGSDTVELAAGDYIQIFGSNSVTTSLGGSLNYFCVERISGPAQVAASELVAAKYYRSANQTSIGNPAVTIAYDTAIFDTHGAFNPSNGRFTAPVAGIYSFLVQFYAGLSNDGQRKSLRYRINGAGTEPYIGQVASIGAGSADRGFAGFNVKLNAGDYVEIRFESTANVDINGGITNNIVDVYKLK